MTLDTLRIITFPRLLKFSMTLVLILFGVRTLSGLPFRGQAPVGAYERNLSGPPVRRSSYQSGLKSVTPVTPVGVESPVGDSTGGGFCALPSGAENRAANTGHRPKNRHPQNGKVKLFPADRGHHVPAPKGGMSALSGLRFLALPVGRSGWPVLVPCPLSLLVVSLVVAGLFGYVLRFV